MQTALLAFQDQFNSSSFRKYDLTPPQVFMDAYKKANTTYIEKCAQTISEKYAIPSDLFDFVKTCVYLANNRMAEQKQKDTELELARQGFCFVVADWLKANPEAKKADIIMQNSDLSQMLGGGTSRVVSGCRIVRVGEAAYFLPPRKRNRGYISSNVMAVRLA
mgnify:CR=1 FL=1